MARRQVRRLPELPLVSLAETIGLYRLFKGRVVPPFYIHTTVHGTPAAMS